VQIQDALAIFFISAQTWLVPLEGYLAVMNELTMTMQWLLSAIISGRRLLSLHGQRDAF
jgi:hypothetical protein